MSTSFAKSLILILALTLCPAARPADAPAAKPSTMPPWGDTSRLGRPFSKDPCVIRFGGRYLMYYSICPFAPDRLPADYGKNGWAIGIAESHDLAHWLPVGQITPVQEVERNGIVNGRVILLNGKLHLFYNSYGNGKLDALLHATSADGLHWDRDPTNPILRATGGWNSGRAIDCDVIDNNGKLLLYYATRDPSMKTQMLAVAAADLGSDFGRAAWKPLGDGPVLKPELPWETRCIEAPAPVRRDGKIYLFYGGGYNNDPQVIACAVSTDGLHFTRLFTDAPMIPAGPPGEWNSSETGHPGVFVDDDGQTYLFFQGNPDHGKTWLLSWVKIDWKDGKPYVVKQ